MAASLATYGNNMKKYVELLPKTDVLIVYFVERKKVVQPHIVEDLRVNKNGIFIRSSLSGQWIQLYPEGSLRCLVARVDNDVKFVTTKTQWSENFETIETQEGGMMECEIGQIGNHLTMGVEVFANRYILNTHTTTYTEDPTKVASFLIEHPIECRVDLLNALSPTSVCLNKKGQVTKDMFVDKYKNEPELVSSINFLKNVYTGGIQVGTGPKGGSYIQKNGRKRYVKRIQSGGATPEQSELIDFIYNNLVKHVIDAYTQYHGLDMEASMIYDTSNYFVLERPVLVLLYDVDEADRRAIFHLDLEQVQLALQYEKLNEREKKSKGQKWRGWNNLQNVRNVHIQAVLAM